MQKHFAFALSLLVAGCTFQPSLTPKATTLERFGASTRTDGSLKLKVEWPSPANRSIAAIPQRTAQFKVTVTGNGISPAIVKTITQQSGAASQTATIPIPAGTGRIILVEAQNSANQTLARGSQVDVVVQTGRYTPVTVVLTSLVGSVAGRVLDGETSAGIAGATVGLNGSAETTTTGSDGSFLLQDVLGGPKTLVVSKDGFESLSGSTNIEIVAGQTVNLQALTILPIHWFKQLTGSTDTLYGVSALSNDMAWACGEGGIIQRTTNGGQSWNALRISGFDSLTFLDVRFRDILRGYAVGKYYLYPGYRPIILISDDGGLNWKQLSLPSKVTNYYPDHYIHSIRFTPPSTVYLLGRQGYYVSYNDGSTWQEHLAYTRDLAQATSDKLWRVDSEGDIYYSSSGGVDWAPQLTGSTYDILRIYCKDEYNVFALSKSGVMLTTNDGGAYWKVYGSTTTDVSFNDFYFKDDSFAYGITDGGRVFVTKDLGRTWAQQKLASGNTTNLKGAFFLNSTTGWAVGNGGNIFRY